jgi:hypothetical protein
LIPQRSSASVLFFLVSLLCKFFLGPLLTKLTRNRTSLCPK